MNIFGDIEVRTFYITALGGYQVVLGMPWLNQVDVRIDFRNYYVSFPPSCKDHLAITHTPQPPRTQIPSNNTPVPRPPISPPKPNPLIQPQPATYAPLASSNIFSLLGSDMPPSPPPRPLPVPSTFTHSRHHAHNAPSRQPPPTFSSSLPQSSDGNALRPTTNCFSSQQICSTPRPSPMPHYPT